MAKKVKVIGKIGNTCHPRLGMLEEGQEYEIEESAFGDEIFEKQKDKIATTIKQSKKEGIDG